MVTVLSIPRSCFFLPEPNQISNNLIVFICYAMHVTKEKFMVLPSEFNFVSCSPRHPLVFTTELGSWFPSFPLPHHPARRAPTLPRPGVSFTLLTARSRQGGAGGGQVCRMPLKLVAKRGGSATEEVEGRCFFFLEDRFNFWAALEGKRAEKGQ